MSNGTPAGRPATLRESVGSTQTRSMLARRSVANVSGEGRKGGQDGDSPGADVAAVRRSASVIVLFLAPRARIVRDC